jgi:hypothetical protein
MKLLAFCLVAATLFAQSTSSFEVKEIDSGSIAKLNAAEAKMEATAKALWDAQSAAKSAKDERDGILKSITSSYIPFEGECHSTKTVSDMGTSWPTDFQRLFVRVEIRGKYALITSGTESCQNWTGTIIGNGGPLSFGNSTQYSVPLVAR